MCVCLCLYLNLVLHIFCLVSRKVERCGGIKKDVWCVCVLTAFPSVWTMWRHHEMGWCLEWISVEIVVVLSPHARWWSWVRAPALWLHTVTLWGWTWASQSRRCSSCMSLLLGQPRTCWWPICILCWEGDLSPLDIIITAWFGLINTCLITATVIIFWTHWTYHRVCFLLDNINH